MQKFHQEIKDQIDYQFTVYAKTTMPNRRYAGNDEYYTGLVYHVVVDKLGDSWIGRSLCSSKDVFNKKIGRAIAKGRAEKAFARINGWGDLQDCNIVTPLGKHINGMSLRRA